MAIGREEEDRLNGKICHAERGARLAREILERHGVDNETIERVVHCVETHRFRGSMTPETLEARILYDADKLDAIGAVGIGRAFLFAGEVGAKLHNKDVDVEKTEQYSKEDTAYREYLVKLRRLKDRMLTQEGKRIAQDRDRFMSGFFERMNKEVDGNL